MPSFDIKSELNAHEVTNGIDQANRVIENRFDFKGTGAKFELTEGKVTLSSQEEFQIHQMLPILKESLAKRGVDLKSLKPDSIEITTGNAKQDVFLKVGIDQELSKKISQMIISSKIKVLNEASCKLKNFNSFILNFNALNINNPKNLP